MSQCFRCLHLATSSYCARARRYLECSGVCSNALVSIRNGLPVHDERGKPIGAFVGRAFSRRRC